MYSHRDNGIECKAQIPVNACQGLCVTGYSSTTGRNCRACQPTNTTLKISHVDCYDNGIKSMKMVYMASALGCECKKLSCGK